MIHYTQQCIQMMADWSRSKRSRSRQPGQEQNQKTRIIIKIAALLNNIQIMFIIIIIVSLTITFMAIIIIITTIQDLTTIIIIILAWMELVIMEVYFYLKPSSYTKRGNWNNLYSIINNTSTYKSRRISYQKTSKLTQMVTDKQRQ